ncbi:hypothetical protein [uncultured Faecalibaculum sp.]|uniref:hypothetical protein n=1 Tax=uncultured Faecalibaculum sp. TaxID=1729681 RepID=UPI0025FB3764|nr:hypothetical protein [uncultured Faecalibaculum sp.]
MLVNERDYKVVRRLPEGKAGSSWVVTDGERNYVLKEFDSELGSPAELTRAQKLGSQRLRAAGIRVPALVDVDYARNRILREYIDGENAFALVLCRSVGDDIVLQLYDMSQRAESAGCNLDYFPTNFVLAKGQLWYVNYDANPFMEEWSLDNWGIQYWRQSPELELYLREYGAEFTGYETGHSTGVQETPAGC